MSEIGDIITDYRQHTRWVGPTDARVAREVPAEVERAIVAYEHALGCRRSWNARHVDKRNAGCEEAAQYALDQCLAYDRLAEWWWNRLQALLPIEPGWYPHGRWLYGFAKRGKCGFRLEREPASSRWPDPDRAAAWALAWSRRRGEEERVREFCTAHKGAIR